ncbi:MAG: hypothetical protein ACREUA_06145 [Burkholderiales bacterium]
METRKIVSIALISALCAVPAAHAHHASSGLGSAQAGPVRALSPQSLQQGRWSAGLSFEYMDLDTLSDGKLAALAAAGEDVHSTDSVMTAALGVGYGISDDFSIYVHLPYVGRDNIREGHFDPPDAEVERLGDSEGVGDLVLLGKYRFFSNAEIQAALLAGVKLPTGETREKHDEGERFETEFQPGSGSFNPIIGVAVMRSWGRTSLTGSLLYTVATEGSQDTDLGDRFEYGVALSYRVSGVGPRHDGTGQQAHHHSAVDLMLELNGEWQDDEELGGEHDANSGSHSLYLSPGVGISGGDGWSASFSVGLPIARHVRGHQDDAGARALFSIGKSF